MHWSLLEGNCPNCDPASYHCIWWVGAITGYFGSLLSRQWETRVSVQCSIASILTLYILFCFAWPLAMFSILLYWKEHGNLYTREISGFFNFASCLSQEVESFRWLKNDPYEQLISTCGFWFLELLSKLNTGMSVTRTCIINHVEK